MIKITFLYFWSYIEIVYKMKKLLKAFIAIVAVFNISILLLIIDRENQLKTCLKSNIFKVDEESQKKLTSKDKGINSTDYIIENDEVSNNSLKSSKTVTKCPVLDQTFTEEEINSYWNYRKYGKCGSNLDHYISFSGNNVTVKCFSGSVPLLDYDHSDIQTMDWVNTNYWYRGDVKDIGNSEYLFVKCNFNTFSHVFNKPKKNITDKATKTSKKFSENSRPLSVLLMVVDSVSRGSFYRNLKKTTKYLKEELPLEFLNKYNLYDFEYTNSVKLNTRPNMAQLLYGHDEETHKQIIGDTPLSESEKYLELQKKAIWNYFSSLGYVTYVSIETIYDYIANLTGREILADHALLNFWRVAFLKHGFDDFKEDQRCLGNHNSHWYQMEYTYQFYNNYRLNNKFGYIHTNAGHESTGNIQTLDDDLKEFLQKILELHNNDDEDFVLFLVSDHGRSLDSFKFDPRLYFDYKIPFTFVITNKELEDRLGGKEFLQYNTQKLIGRYDIHLTLKDLAWAPYKNRSDDYELFKAQYPVEGVSSLFREYVNENRTCEDLGIELQHCICNEFKYVDVNDTDETIIVNNILKLSEDYIDLKIQSRPECQKIHVQNFKAQKFEFTPKDKKSAKVYKLQILAQKNTIINVSANFATNNTNTQDILNTEMYPVLYFNHEQVAFFVQIASISVKNSCNQNLCIC